MQIFRAAKVGTINGAKLESSDNATDLALCPLLDSVPTEKFCRACELVFFQYTANIVGIDAQTGDACDVQILERATTILIRLLGDLHETGLNGWAAQTSAARAMHRLMDLYVSKLTSGGQSRSNVSIVPLLLQWVGNLAITVSQLFRRLKTESQSTGTLHCAGVFDVHLDIWRESIVGKLGRARTKRLYSIIWERKQHATNISLTEGELADLKVRLDPL